MTLVGVTSRLVDMKTTALAKKRERTAAYEFGWLRRLIKMEQQVMVTDGKWAQPKKERWLVFVGPTKRPRRYTGKTLGCALLTAVFGETERSEKP